MKAVAEKIVRFFRPAPQLSLEEYELRLLKKGIGPDGLIPDPVPIAPPIGYKRQPSMTEIVRNAVRSERLALEAQLAGFETFEESEDFDLDDDFVVPRSIHEFEGQPSIQELREAVAENQAAIKAAEAAKAGGGGAPPAANPKAAEPPPLTPQGSSDKL